MIETTTWIDLFPIWVYSLFDSSQNVSHMYKQLLSSKRISTCSIIPYILILVKFWYFFIINEKNHHEDRFLAKQNIQWWDEWIMISQMFLFVITSISVSRITRALCKSITVYDADFTLKAVIPKFKLTVRPTYMMFDGNSFRQMYVCLLTLF